MTSLRQEWFVRGERANAAASWLLVGLLVVAVAWNAATGRPVRAGFAALLVGVTLVPAASARSWRQMMPWPLVLLASLSVLLEAVLPPLLFDVVGSIGVAALALLVAVDLQLLTTVRMSAGFAVVFVVVASMGLAGFWAVARWLGSLFLGTPFVATNDELMYEFLVVTASGALAGLVFRHYFRRWQRQPTAEMAVDGGAGTADERVEDADGEGETP